MQTIGIGNQTDRNREKWRFRSIRQIMGTSQFETENKIHWKTNQRHRLHNSGDKTDLPDSLFISITIF